jgi:hypothetical protein
LSESVNANRILTEKAEAKRLLGGRRHSWEDNIEMDLKEVDLEVTELLHLLVNRDQWRTVEKMVPTFWTSSISGKFLVS